MRKFIILLLLLPVTVLGVTCNPVKDTQTSYDRTLTCDADESTVTVFTTDTPKVNKVKLDNDVCKIECIEDVIYSVDPIKKVLAGTGFNYPLYVSGERRCTATYKYTEYESEIKRLINKYNEVKNFNNTIPLIAFDDSRTCTTQARNMCKLDGKNLEISGCNTPKNGKYYFTCNTSNYEEEILRTIVNLYDDKKQCDNYVNNYKDASAKYTHNGNVSLKIETSQGDINVPYKFVEMQEYESKSIIDEEKYNSACNYNEITKKCDGSDKTISGWTNISRVFGKYTMDDVYLEKYTGKVKNVYSDKTCNAGDKYFTDFQEFSRPKSGDETDNGYKLTLVAKNIGNNLGKASPVWNLTVNCWYELENLIFPQNTPARTDENYPEYGNTAFRYRLIDLSKPFPDRDAGANWKGYEHLITNNLSMLEKFVITLDRSSIGEIKEYNSVHSYDTFNLDEMEKSPFIVDNHDIIDRK